MKVKYILSDREKYQKDSDQGSEEMRNLFLYYESLGVTQTF